MAFAAISGDSAWRPGGIDMARFTSIDRLPEEVRALIAKRRQEDRWTIAEIQRELAELGYRVALSSQGRHTRRTDGAARASSQAEFDPVLAELRRCRAALEALCNHFGAPRSVT
jgi:hypothetical protein